MGQIIVSILPVIGIVMGLKRLIGMEMSTHTGNYNLGHTSDGIIFLFMVLLIVVCIALLFIYLASRKGKIEDSDAKYSFYMNYWNN